MFETAHRRAFEDLSRQLDRVVDQLLQRHYPTLPGQGWSPAVNAYRLPGRLEVCVDLAGVDRSAIEVHVEEGRLTIRGRRPTPLPPSAAPGDGDHPAEPIHIIAMEIDDGEFERQITLPRGVHIREATAEQVNGMLWVKLPLKNKNL